MTVGSRVSLLVWCQGEDQGVVTEFVNPKFKDSTRTAFTKPTRLECMMQVRGGPTELLHVVVAPC